MTSKLSPLVIKNNTTIRSIAKVEKDDKRSILTSMLKYILQRILLDIAYFPLWWYTRGLLKIIRFGGRSISDIERNLALGIWLKAMFKPMFQDYTWEGRLVSFFMRAVLLIFKTLMFFVWVIGVIILIIAWLALPVVAVYLIIALFNL